jgi:sugar phosphate permease
MEKMINNKYTKEELTINLNNIDLTKEEIDLVFKYTRIPFLNIIINGILLCVLGFLVYGPQFLVGVMVTDLATKRAAASAIGLTGFFGYLSSVVSGWGLGWVVDNYGWHGGFILLMICSVVATALFALTWNVKPKEEGVLTKKEGVLTDERKRTEN